MQAGTQLMAVVPLDAVYVVANFKETQLTHVRNGQPVEIRIDSFHGTRLTGHVDSLSPASGLEFALLPPDNATGNFTKIVQRVPVKIVLDDHSLTGLLRPGMSAEPTINTKATRAGRSAKPGRGSPRTPRRFDRSGGYQWQSLSSPAGQSFHFSAIIEPHRPMHPVSVKHEETPMTALHPPSTLASADQRRPVRRDRPPTRRSPPRPGSP